MWPPVSARCGPKKIGPTRYYTFKKIELKNQSQFGVEFKAKISDRGRGENNLVIKKYMRIKS
jgi:hypothetical protein